VDPLAQLKDIQLPEQIHNYPLAIGWWILAAVIIALILFTLAKIKSSQKKRQAQKQAIAQLSSQSPSVDEIIVVLKWAALQYFPRNEIASLSGSKLQDFLTEQLPEKYSASFSQLCGSTIENRYKRPTDNENNDDFHQASILWLKQALPPSAHSNKNVKSTGANT